MALAYYFPNVAGFEPGMPDKHGLTTVFAGRSPSASNIEAGPDGGRGVIVTFRDDDQFRRDWTWVDCGGFHVGYDDKAPPGPAAVVRPRTFDGYFVELGDGNKWLVPVARFDSPNYSLPKAIRLDAHGKRLHDLLPAHRRLEALAMTAFAGFRNQLDGDGDEVRVDEGFAFDAAAEALGVNYYVGRWECSALGLFTTHNVYVVLSLLCDWPGYKAMTDGLAASKKNA